MPPAKRTSTKAAAAKATAKAGAVPTASSNGRAAPRTAPPRIRIEAPWPAIDGGRFAVKRTPGEPVEATADIIRDGHDVLGAAVLYRKKGARKWNEAPMVHLDAHVKGDRWGATFTVDEIGPWEWTVQAWTDPFAAWVEEMKRKIAFGQTDLDSEVAEGALMLKQTAERAKGAAKKLIEHTVKVLEDPAAPDRAKHDAALGAELYEAVEAAQERHECTTMEPAIPIEVDRERARFGSWYELFPRSWGGFAGVTEAIPKIAALGFDVLYLPPVHPIGLKHRKGRNNALVAGKKDPGSPWAIGHHDHGGHEALHPELGTWDEFDAMVRAGQEHGLEIALDFALNASADHPWLTEHPDWFHRRPDGTLKYAENPPKKYQDIYNFNWNTESWRDLWQAVYDVLRHWVDLGVRVFRVDNPHTKPFAMWEWLIAEIKKDDPDVLFLAEAFTRRKVMQQLAKLGFSQSYTYFTWKNFRWDLTEYVSELAHGPESEYFRPNFFLNTPDILTEYLQDGGPSAFYIRAILGATLSPTYGVYSGFEHYENIPREAGSEEYLNTEKFEAHERALDGPMLPFLAHLNGLRRAHPALQFLDNVAFLGTENDALIAYAKRTGDDLVITIVNMDPHHAQEGTCVVPYELGLPPAFSVEDLLSGEVWDWRLGRNYVRLDPLQRVGHVLHVRG
jgi:starch synthase (maltosyl-transferring)